MNTSYSALETFKTCRLKYKIQEIDKIKAPKSKEAVFGTIMHSTLKFLHNPQPVSPTIEETLEFYGNLWNSELYKDKQEETAVLSHGVKIIQDYYAKNNPKKFNVVALETRFSLDINAKSDKVTVNGIIDRIDRLSDGSFEIIDYKTNKNLPSQKEVDDDFQLSIYHMALAERWPKINRPVKSSLYFLKHGIKLSTYKTTEQISKAKKHILGTVEEIKKGEFIPMPNALCDWCGYQEHCPMFKHKFKKNITNEDKDIKEIVEEYYSLKSEDKKNSRRLAELSKAINDYCDRNKIERVFSENFYITRALQQTFDYDIEKVKRVLQPLGLWDEVTSINSVKLNKIIGKLHHKEKKEIENAKILKKEFKRLNLKKT